MSNLTSSEAVCILTASSPEARCNRLLIIVRLNARLTVIPEVTFFERIADHGLRSRCASGNGFLSRKRRFTRVDLTSRCLQNLSQRSGCAEQVRLGNQGARASRADGTFGIGENHSPPLARGSGISDCRRHFFARANHSQSPTSSTASFHALSTTCLVSGSEH